MNICLFGANHKTAEIEFREKIAFSNEDFPEAVEEPSRHNKEIFFLPWNRFYRNFRDSLLKSIRIISIAN